jgi:hypothetical protein
VGFGGRSAQIYLCNAFHQVSGVILVGIANRYIPAML